MAAAGTDATGQDRKRAWLVLEDGTRFEGRAFGDDTKSVSGEAVFQTGMVGYTESLTDPSYTRQLLVLTFPLIGNYGVPPEDKDENGLPLFFESEKIHPAGLVVADLSETHSHWNAVRSLSDWLKSQGVPGITGIDTRAVTKKLRVDGSMLGKIVIEGDDEASVPFVDPNTDNLVATVSNPAVREFNPSGDVSIVAVDVGLKYNQLRCLIKRGAKVTVVPWDHDFASMEWDGLFLSNGPGDPAILEKTIANIASVLNKESPKPVFGICLGHQLMALAAGAKTFKMPFGNRGHNQPCTLSGTGRCFITSQNHGFAVETETLPEGWSPLFTNENDGTNEGIIHDNKPFFAVQFHPEASAGPEDVEPLFDAFLERVRSKTNSGSMLPAITSALCSDELPAAVTGSVSKVVVLGSGGLSIGQAGEFDYSGSQAMKALKEEGINTVLINPNIATVQTMKGLADRVYFLPVTVEYVERVIEFERPDGILLSFGGQTALNCGIKLNERGVFEKYNVKVLGTPVRAIVDTEDREVFGRKLEQIGEHVCPNVACSSVEEVMAAAEKFGFPVMMRSSFALGGLGSGVVEDKEKLYEMAVIAFASTTQVSIEPSALGWKEIEYEVVRDAYDNTITVCNMENFDPLGVHTGESIVVAPSQTLNNEEYNLLRSVACKVVRHIGIVGECNIQYAMDPHSKKYFIIEVNARLSRSSALASKATGYPLAYVAAKLALGQSLAELRNAVTRKTTACFEPSLDYCVVKIPRWDLGKFPGVDKKLGTSMKSVGEVMAIGRTFEEAMQKALRMVDIGVGGFDSGHAEATDDGLTEPSEQRPLIIAEALSQGYTVDRIHELSKIDRWFLACLKRIADQAKLLQTSNVHSLTRDQLLYSKKLGFSDSQIAGLIKSNELAVRQRRRHFKLRPVIKQIDTVAAEYPAVTNYLYLTYNGVEDDVSVEGGYMMVLGSGVYRIGSSVEFDYCAVGCVRELKRLGYKTIMVNYNPETVSTDYDECDRLYFDQLTFETVLDVYEFERAMGVILSMGGQIPNNMASKLDGQKVKIFGTSAAMIDSAENRYKFSRMCDSIGVDQPKWKELESVEAARDFCAQVGFPCLMRPSYVLSGTAMRVVYSSTDLEESLKTAVVVSRDFPVVMSKFILDAKEIEVDAVAREGQIVVHAVSEHIENAGVHSGDATIVHPPQDLTQETMDGVVKIAQLVAQNLHITGPFNIQFIAKDDKLKVIECNVRASRSFPFVSKTMDIDMIAIATQVMLGMKPTIPQRRAKNIGVKVPQFSFNRLAGSDPTLGVDMISTGEVACFGTTRAEAYVKAMMSTGFALPKKSILLSIGSFKGKQEFLPATKQLAALGFELYGSIGTADFYDANGVAVKPVDWIGESEEMTAITDHLADGKFDLVINLPTRSKIRRPASFTTSGKQARRMAIDLRVPLITDIKCAKLFVEALGTVNLTPAVQWHDFQSAQRTVKVPGFVDTGVLYRDARALAAEGATADAVSNGFTSLFAMSSAPDKDAEEFSRAASAAVSSSFCDIGLLLNASEHSDTFLHDVEPLGLNLNLSTDAGLSVGACMKHFEKFDASKPILVQASSHHLASVLFFAQMHSRHVHVCFVRTKDEIDLIIAAKKQGTVVTCSVCALDLFGFRDENPHSENAKALWSNIANIDVFATGQGFVTHDNETVPAASLAIPLLLTAMHEGRLTRRALIDKLHYNPTRIFGLKEQPDTFVEIALREQGKLSDRCDRLPAAFADMKVTGRVTRVVLRGNMIFVDGKHVPGTGKATALEATVPSSGVAITKTSSPLPEFKAIESPSPLRRPAGGILGRASPQPLSADVVPSLSSMSPSRLEGQHILSVSQFTRDDLHELFNRAHDYTLSVPNTLLQGKVLANVFFEPSTRTMCSFSAAMTRLGGSVVAMSQTGSSTKKGETMLDTVRTMECYSDVTVMRHPEPGSVSEAAGVAVKPVINAGDGIGEHPTQALLDVFTIREELGTVNGLRITLVGDLKHGRTVHSLARLLCLYRVQLRYVSPESLELPIEVMEFVGRQGIQQSQHRSVQEVIEDTDVLYVTRIQQERFGSEAEYEKVKGSYIITPELLQTAKTRMIVMHPLPRVNEISTEVDTDPRAAYFRQMEYGMFVRMALLAKVLGK
eukprot:m.84922 g.84922  ORF g.84922 m.84922 type:complete len:2136 (+) comp14823_c0_seq1:208-6615(+)